MTETSTLRIATLLTSLTAGLFVTLTGSEAQAAVPPALEAVGPIRSGLDANKCVDIQGANMSNMNNVGLWECHDWDHHTWYLNMNGEIRSAANANFCLDALGGNVTIYTCDGTDEQEWTLSEAGELLNGRYPGMCLDAVSGNSANGTNLRMYTCNGTAAQQFTVARVPWAEVHSAVHADRCLDVDGAGTAKGTNVKSWECNGNKAQAWFMTADGELRSGVGANRCLDVSGSPQNGANVQLWECNGTAAQEFYVDHLGQLRMAANDDYCVDVQGGSAAAGTNVQLYQCNGTSAQRWSSTSFMQVGITTLDGGNVAVLWAEGDGGYALTDPVAVLETLELLGASDAELTSIVDQMSTVQRSDLFGRLGSNPVAFVNASAAQDAGLMQPVSLVDGLWEIEGGAGVDTGVWGIGGGASVSDGFAVLHVSAGGVQISGGAGIVDVSNVLSSPIGGSASFDLSGGQTGFSVRLLNFQVDLYVTGVDLGATVDDAVSLAVDFGDWTDQATVDAGDWFEGAGQDIGSWTEGAADSVGDAFESVFDEISSWF